MILVTSLFINSPVQLTSYPTILLLTTIFRLSLSVGVTRNILAHGESGSVVESLGHVTAQGSLITGAVFFIIILVVQFIVVSKGAERVAEVAARFTLDAMPGKQMAIDADLRSGLITQEEARRQRIELGKESQLHGAMDGAMKFVKGDSIWTIIIAAVNIVAGLATGVLVRGMEISEAAGKIYDCDIRRRTRGNYLFAFDNAFRRYRRNQSFRRGRRFEHRCGHRRTTFFVAETAVYYGRNYASAHAAQFSVYSGRRGCDRCRFSIKTPSEKT